MKKYLLFPSVFCFIMSQTICQELLPMQSLDLDLLLSKQIESKEATSPSNKFYSSNFNLPKSNQASFLSITFSFDKVLKTPGSEISLKLWDTSEGEIEIIPLTFDNHELKDPDQVIFTNPAYISTDKITFQIVYSSPAHGNKKEIKVQVHIFNPGVSEGQDNIYNKSISARNELCERPFYLDRNAWCPTCPEDATPEFTIPTHLIIHHSAGSNTSSDWPAVVRSIWDYHVNVRGWDDIGYNWLIDPNGILYEGRGDDRQGAHFCGFNQATMGCCMLGTYTNSKPTDESREALIYLMAWKANDLEIDPTIESLHSSSGLELKHVSGHRDGCSTECPGSSFYADIDELRSEIKTYIEEECTEEAIYDPEIIMGPNPNYGFFTLQNTFNEPLNLDIFGADGKHFANSRIDANSGLFVDLRYLPSGIYIIILDGETVHWKNKFVVL